VTRQVKGRVDVDVQIVETRKSAAMEAKALNIVQLQEEGLDDDAIQDVLKEVVTQPEHERDIRETMRVRI
jgi:hypothetical protein